MSRRRRHGAGRTPGALSAVVTSVLAAVCVLALAGCSFVAPEPGPTPWRTPECLEGGLEETLPQALQDALDLYGFWSLTWDNPPGAGDLAHPAPVPLGFDPRRKVWLTSILLAPGVSGRVWIASPQDARLFVASDWDRMGSLTAIDLQFGSTRGVSLRGCEGIASYPGLTIVDGPECVVFAMQREGDDRIAQISVPFFGAEC